MAWLFVIQGPDQGKRFELGDAETPSAVILGRDASNPIRLRDIEVSRRHAEVRSRQDGDGAGFELLDLHSANGTFLNGKAAGRSLLKSGDHVRLGQSVMVFNDPAGRASAGARRDRAADLAQRVDVSRDHQPGSMSAILNSIAVEEGSRILRTPDAPEWLTLRPASLATLYQSTLAVNHILDPDELLEKVLDLAFDATGADRGTILLVKAGGDLKPKATRWRGGAGPDERLAISRTIVDHVLDRGRGVVTTNAPADERFGPAPSILAHGIREAICVPLQGRHSTPGVIYVDVRADMPDPKSTRPAAYRFTRDHLSLMAAIGHQAGLALENTQFHEATLQSERLAAVGQTIATLSHHIKNILQGLRGGGHLIELGLDQDNEEILRRGWSIVEKNQNKIYELVMDMLSFSKEREPALDLNDLNEVVGEVVELMQSRAEELGVALEWRPAPALSPFLFDAEGIHRATLNLVTNALDAAEGAAGARVAVATAFLPEGAIANVTIADNGVGIPEGEQSAIFQIYSSSKGSRGTGLGLPVSEKIVREHGGRIAVRSRPGEGATFTIELPWRGTEDSRDEVSLAVGPGPSAD